MKIFFTVLAALMISTTFSNAQHLDLSGNSYAFGTRDVGGGIYSLTINFSRAAGVSGWIGISPQIINVSVPAQGSGCPAPTSPFSFYKSGGDSQGYITSQTGNSVTVYFDPRAYDYLSGATCEDTLSSDGAGNYSATLSISYSGSASGVNGVITIPISGLARLPIVNIPDANFKTCLVGDTTVNINNDGDIQVAEAQTFTGILDCSNLNISSLSGVEMFAGITELNCSNNLLTSLNLSSNTALTKLECRFNQITNLNINSNTNLTHLYCNNNQLSTLNLANNAALVRADVQNNQLTTLNLANNTALNYLTCSSNQLSALNLTTNVNLNTIYCNLNQLTSLNVKNGNNTAITTFHAEDNANLLCIEVDDTTYSNTNWATGNFMFDSQTVFSEDCASTIAINKILGDIPFVIYPNPASSFVTISNLPIASTIRVFDFTGKIIYASIVADEQITIPTSDFSNGIYLLQVETDEKMASQKIIIN